MAIDTGPVFTMSAMSASPAPLADHCQERNCAAAPAVHCAYVDSRGKICGTSWCSRHARRIGEGHYCRRHASTVAALGAKSNDPRALPPVGHRGASLVNWICTEGHDALSGAVTKGAQPGEVVFEDRTVNVVRTAAGSRQWERGWRLGDRNGITTKVVVAVDEGDDATVYLKLNAQVLAQGVPPWITRRRQGQVVPAAIDAEDRRQFYSFLERFIVDALSARH